MNKFIKDITCRHAPTKQHAEKKNYNAHVRIFVHDTPEGMLLCCTKIQDIYFKKPCDDAESKFDITKLLLEGQAKSKFLQFRTEHKYAGVTIKACTTRLKEIKKYLKYFPGPDLNIPLADFFLLSPLFI